MAVFSTNQVRQLYVANEFKEPSVLATDKAGSISVHSDKTKTHLYFKYKGADNMMRSDLIDIKNILSIKATDANALAKDLKSVKVTLDPQVNGGNPVAGQDYLLRILFRQYIGISDEHQYFKYGMVHAVSGMTASDFYKKLAISLAKNFSRELVSLVSFKLVNTSNTEVPVTATTKESELAAQYKALVIDEVPQEWTLGIKEQVPVYFEVFPDQITVDGDNRTWGIVEDVKSKGKVDNGHTIADLEYFCMGERGDQYRNIGWPKSIPTTYLVNPNLKYNVIDIHYAYVGANENVQKSEKTITIVVPKVGEGDSVSNALANSIVGAIETATGLTIGKLNA